jgi:predicted permease
MTDVNFRSWHIGLAGATVCPAAGLIVAWLLDHVLPLGPMQRGQMYLFASLPPAVFCFMIAELYQQVPDKVAAIVLLGNLAALVFVPIGLWAGLAR